MRLMNLDGRLHVVDDRGAFDVETLSGGTFGSEPQHAYDRWADLSAWVGDNIGAAAPTTAAADIVRTSIGSPAPAPRQVFAVGLNYLEHADESGFTKPEHPLIFTKYSSSITGPVTTVGLPEGSVDWEVELVVVVGVGGRHIAAADGWSHVAGVSVGQDISERQLQHSGPAPQFSLAKSHEGFSPIGPVLVTVDELDNPDDLEIGASINGEAVQTGRTSQLIFPVSVLIEELSRTVELLPGDVIFTGTPSGVGAGRVPPRFLVEGDVLTSYIAGIGELEQTFVSKRLSPADFAVGVGIGVGATRN